MTNVSTCADAKTGQSVDELSIRIARSPAELRKAFRLVFERYYRAGLETAKASRIRLTPYHLLPTSEVLIAERNSVITSTLSMFGDSPAGLPMESMYGQQICHLRSQGFRLAEIGSLADRRNGQGRFINTFVQIGRLLAQVAQSRGIDVIVAAVHPRHARLYEKVMGFRQIGHYSSCPYANGNPAVALCLKFDDHLGTPLHDQYFGTPLPEEELLPYQWETNTREFFAEILERESNLSEVTSDCNY